MLGGCSSFCPARASRRATSRCPAAIRIPRQPTSPRLRKSRCRDAAGCGAPHRRARLRGHAGRSDRGLPPPRRRPGPSPARARSGADAGSAGRASGQRSRGARPGAPHRRDEPAHRPSPRLRFQRRRSRDHRRRARHGPGGPLARNRFPGAHSRGRRHYAPQGLRPSRRRPGAGAGPRLASHDRRFRRPGPEGGRRSARGHRGGRSCPPA